MEVREINLNRAFEHTINFGLVFNLGYAVVLVCLVQYSDLNFTGALKLMKAFALFEMIRLTYQAHARAFSWGVNIGHLPRLGFWITVISLAIFILIFYDAVDPRACQTFIGRLGLVEAYQPVIAGLTVIPLTLGLMFNLATRGVAKQHLTPQTSARVTLIRNHYAYHIMCVDLPSMSGVALIVVLAYLPFFMGFELYGAEGSSEKTIIFVSGALAMLIVYSNVVIHALDILYEEVAGVTEAKTESA
jgi:hypothetical protein